MRIGYIDANSSSNLRRLEFRPTQDQYRVFKATLPEPKHTVELSQKRRDIYGASKEETQTQLRSRSEMATIAK